MNKKNRKFIEIWGNEQEANITPILKLNDMVS